MELLGTFALIFVAVMQVILLWYQHHITLIRENRHRLFELWPIMTSIIDVHPDHPVPVTELPEIANKLELIALARLRDLVDEELFDITFKDLFIRYCEMIAMGKDQEDNRGYTYLYQTPFVLKLYEKYTQRELQTWVALQQRNMSLKTTVSNLDGLKESHDR